MSLEAIEIDGRDAIKFKLNEKTEYILTSEELTEVGFSNYNKELELDDKELKFDHYRILRRMYCRGERNHRKQGKQLHVSKYSDTAWKYMNQEYFNEHGEYPKQKGSTYVRDQSTEQDN